MNKKEKDLKYVMKLFAQSAMFATEARKLGQRYTDEYCPYKRGMKLIIQPEYGQKENAVVNTVRFDEHATMIGMAILCVVPYSQDWTKRKDRRSNVWIKKDAEILEIIQ